MKVLFFEQRSTICWLKNKEDPSNVKNIITAFWEPFIEDFKENSEEFTKKYNAKINDEIPSHQEFHAKLGIVRDIFAKRTQTEHVVTEVPMLHQIVDTMILNNWFWFAEGLDQTMESHQLKQLTLSKVEKFIKENYTINKAEIEVRENADVGLPELKNLGYTLCLIGETDFHLTNTLMLQALGIFEWFDDFLFYHCEFKHKMLEHKIKKYEKKGIKRYEMAIVGGNIIRDITTAADGGIRTVFFGSNSTQEDYEGFEHGRPDFDLLGHNQGSSTLTLMDIDIEYIEGYIMKDTESATSTYMKFKKELPSQNMINIGVCTRHANKMVDSGMLQHSRKVQFKAVNLYVPLEHQTPLDAIIFTFLNSNSSDPEEDHVEITDKANKFGENNNIIVIDNDKAFKLMQSSSGVHDELEKFFNSPLILEISYAYDQVIRIPRTISVKESEEEQTKEHILKLGEESKLDYPFVVKTDKALHTSHGDAKYIVHDEKALTDIGENKEFVSEDNLFRFYGIAEQALFWKLSSASEIGKVNYYQ